MNKDEFEASFKSGSAAGMMWAKTHGKATLGIACFLIGFILGKLF